MTKDKKRQQYLDLAYIEIISLGIVGSVLPCDEDGSKSTISLTPRDCTFWRQYIKNLNNNYKLYSIVPEKLCEHIVDRPFMSSV
jgi:hypothetical protein